MVQDCGSGGVEAVGQAAQLAGEQCWPASLGDLLSHFPVRSDAASMRIRFGSYLAPQRLKWISPMPKGFASIANNAITANVR